MDRADLMEGLDLDDQRRRLLEYLLEGAGEPGPADKIIKPREGGNRLPISFSQQRLWILNQLLPDDSVYNIPAAIRLSGVLHIAALRDGLREIIRRHEALRTVFDNVEGEPIQVVLEHPSFDLPVIDLAELDAAERDDQVGRLQREEAMRRFNLGAGPLFRTRLVILGRHEYVLLLDMHHIVSDGWSMGILTREMAALYRSFIGGRSSPLVELAIQFGDFALWQREWLQSRQAAEDLAYWKRQLEGAAPVLELPAASQRPAIQSFRGGRQTLLLDDTSAGALRTLCRRQGVTLFMLILAAFKVLLCRYTGEFDILVGTPIANRNRWEVEPLIGYFLNTLVLRTPLSGNPTFVELLGRVRDVALGAFTHQDVPFEMLVEVLQPQRDLSRTPLFQVMFNMLNFGETPIELPLLKTEAIESAEIQSKFDLTLFAAEDEERIELTEVFNADLFDSAAVNKTLMHFRTLLAGIIEDPNRRILELPLLPESERRQVRSQPVSVENVSFVRFDPDSVEQSIWSRFEQQASKYPANIALKTEVHEWTYAELREKAIGLARTIISMRGSEPEMLPLLIQDDALMIVALLAVLSTGKTYVPLDPDYPIKRLEYMVEDCGSSAILIDEGSLTLASELDRGDRQIIRVEDRADSSLPIGQLPVANPDCLAYILYTSGSTGQPKGVVQNHRNVLHHIRCYTNSLFINPRDRLACLSSYSFDAAVMDIFGALLNGATLCRFNIKKNGLDRLSEWLGEQEISIYHSTPSVYRYFARTLGPHIHFPSLRLVVLGGEEVLRSDVELYKKYFGPDCTLVNGFGPTESTLGLQYFIRPDSDAAQDNRPETVPIGYAVEATDISLINDAGEQVAEYGLGEIVIKSNYVALGYWGKPTLSQSSFAAEQAPGNRRVYFTGDIGRRLPDLSIQYVGRKDHQVKVRGCRVEPGDVESAVENHPDIETCAVVPKRNPGGETYLACYVTSVQTAKLDVAQLVEFSRSKLPEYMVPAAFHVLTKMPLTVNGKVDRRALADLDVSELTSRTVNVSLLRTPAEEIVAGIFADVLGIDGVALNENFFELGGHSLLAMLVVSRIRRTFGVDVQLRAFFANPTVASLCALVNENRSLHGGPSLEHPTAERGWDGIASHDANAVRLPSDSSAPLEALAGNSIPPYPLSFAQQRLYFLDQLYPGSSLYNIPAAVKLTGALSGCALEHSLHEVLLRQASLRTTFGIEAEAPVQIIANKVGTELIVADLTGLQEQERELEARRLAREQAQRPFDLACGPVFRASLLRLGDSAHVLAFTIHHIASDGWSIGILIKEISAIYGYFSLGLPDELGWLPIQYVGFAIWQRARLQEEILESELSYWKETLAGAPALLEVPTDRPRPAVQSYRGQIQLSNLSGQLSSKIARLSREQGVTKFMTLLAAFIVLLCRYSGQEEVLIGTPMANRDLPEFENLIGLFVNTLVLRLGTYGDPTFPVLLARIRETILEAFAHRELPFEKLVEELNPSRSLSHAPLFQVAFVLQNMPLPSAEVQGLRMSLLDLHDGTSKFDLTLSITETSNGDVALIEYSSDLFDSTTIARLLAEYQTLLQYAAADQEKPVSLLPLLTEGARHQVAVEWNDANLKPSSELCLQDLLQLRAASAPDSAAVVLDAQVITYGELNARANQLGNYLRRQGVRPETLVVIYTERSLEFITGVAGILKAGGAYVPIDPACPKQRIAHILDDVRSPVVLTQAALTDNLPRMHAHVLCLDRDWPEITKEDRDRPRHVATPGNAAYVIYTSGTTGQPKGVIVTHRNLLRLFESTETRFSFGEQDVWAFFHSQAFDFSVWEIWGALIYGGKLVVVPYLISRSPHSFYLLAQAEGITVLSQTPSAFRHFIQESLGAQDRGLSIRCVIFGGEALDLRILRPWAEHGPQMINMYGITETTVHVTYKALAADDIERAAGSIIGRPIRDMTLYILDKRLEIVPLGVAGELYVGGAGLARGYLNHPEWTAERFMPGNLPSTPGIRLYKTGDLGRYRPNAEIDHLGRIDDQLKIRGFRVEPAEIESVLAAEPSVRNAAVIAVRDDSGDARLIAYLVPENGRSPTAGSLRSLIIGKLPDYMIPAAFVLVEDLPITTNGKLDKARLPAPGHARPDLAEEFVPASTEEESILAQVWCEVLRLDRVGVNDGFFALGGDSIRCIQLKAAAERRGISFRLEDIFTHQTIRGLARVVTLIDNNERIKGDQPLALVSERDRMMLPNTIVDAYPLARLQSQMLLYSDNRGSSTYHDVFSFHIKCRLDLPALRKAVQQVIDGHAALRTSFDLTSYREPLQLVQERVDGTVELGDIAHLTHEEQGRELRRWIRQEVSRPFDPTDPPLIRFHVHRRGDDTFQFSTSFHHAILDGWSHASLLTELFQRYRFTLQGRDSEDYPVNRGPSASYRDFVILEQEAIDSSETRAYWTQRLEGATITSVTQKPSREITERSTVLRGRVESVQLPVTSHETMRRLAETIGVPLKTILLAVHLRVLSLLTGQQNLVTGLICNGRPERPGGERVLGLFLNVVPFRLNLAPGTWIDLIKATFEAERELLPYRRYPLAEFLAIRDGRPLFETFFNYIDFHVYQGLPTSNEIEVLGTESFEEMEWPLGAYFSPGHSSIHLTLHYHCTRFSRRQIKAIGRCYQDVLAGITNDPRAQHENSTRRT